MIHTVDLLSQHIPEDCPIPNLELLVHSQCNGSWPTIHYFLSVGDYPDIHVKEYVQHFE